MQLTSPIKALICEASKIIVRSEFDSQVGDFDLKSKADNIMKKHKHCELIKAWADGAEVEYYCTSVQEWYFIETPLWCESTSYRIKPQPKRRLLNREEMEGLVGEPLRLKGGDSIFIATSFIRTNLGAELLKVGDLRYTADSLDANFTLFDYSPLTVEE